jgi:F-type H+-transporting ATPase subunit delta
MLLQPAAKRYARALFELAREKDLLDRAWEQFDALAEYLKKDKTFLNFISAPQILYVSKVNLMKTAFESRMERPFYDFLLFLLHKHRMNILPEIIDEFEELVRFERGIVRAICITSFTISDTERRVLIETLARKTAKKIELEEKIDKSIIGGMIVILNNQIIDGSIRYNLSLLRNRLMKVKVH